jgi:hypothetical protein
MKADDLVVGKKRKMKEQTKLYEAIISGIKRRCIQSLESQVPSPDFHHPNTPTIQPSLVQHAIQTLRTLPLVGNTISSEKAE